jgi:proteasome lid subunit RPN8/RPN11
VVLTDEVSRTLFDEYAVHRQGSRGHEETGWLLLGLREPEEAIVLATLPAGAESEAGSAHVHFNASAQALASRIVRQSDRRLTILGVVHTHPGSLRHPSDGDMRGDSVWVEQLRGGEGVFGIGTADAEPRPGILFGQHSPAHVQGLGPLRLSWYALATGAGSYRAVPVELTLGPDLARPLHSVWGTIEAHADRLDRLCGQQLRIRFEVIPGRESNALVLTLPLALPGHAVRVFLEKGEVRYFFMRHGEMLASEADDPRVDRGVYLLLAELAGQ